MKRVVMIVSLVCLTLWAVLAQAEEAASQQSGARAVVYDWIAIANGSIGSEVLNTSAGKQAIAVNGEYDEGKAYADQHRVTELNTQSDRYRVKTLNTQSDQYRVKELNTQGDRYGVKGLSTQSGRYQAKGLNTQSDRYQATELTTQAGQHQVKEFGGY